MSAPNLDGYVEVNERIAAFYERYPEGNLSCGGWYMKTLGEQQFVVYKALAHRSPQDKLPAVGLAWEPFPGKTSFTRDSELQNAETSAWGRALAALGFEVKRGIATKEEVEARTNGPEPTKNSDSPTTPATAKQIPRAKKKLKDSDLSDEAQKAIWVWGHTASAKDGGKTLSRPAADAILDARYPQDLRALADRAGFSDLPPPDDVPDESVPEDEKVPF